MKGEVQLVSEGVILRGSHSGGAGVLPGRGAGCNADGDREGGERTRALECLTIRIKAIALAQIIVEAEGGWQQGLLN